MHSFETIRARLERRQRLIQGSVLASWALLGSLGVTALVLLGSTLGIWGATPLPAWVIGNLLVGTLAFVGGWLRPINTIELLFRADRHLHSSERFVTLYELSLGYGPQEFLPLLERQLNRLSVNTAQALPLPSRDKWRWAVVAILAVICVSTTGFVQLGSLFVHTETDQSRMTAQESLESQRASQLLEWLQTPPAELAQKLMSVRERLEQARAALALNPNDPRARAALQQLHAELIQEQQRLAPPLPLAEEEQPKRSRPESSLVEGSPGEPRPPQQGTSEALELNQLLQSLRRVSEQAQSLSPEELQKLLEQLRETNPDAAALAEQVLQLTQTPEEFRERLEEILRELEARQALREQLENLQRELESTLAQAEPQVAREESSSGFPSAMSSSEEGSPQAQQQGLASEAHGIQSQERQEEGQTSAGAGRGTAPLDPEAAQDLPDLSQLRERSRSLSVPGTQSEDLEILFEIVTMELPQDTESSSSAVPVQIDYGKVEALLDMLEIPEELRDAVRQYFLSLGRQR